MRPEGPSKNPFIFIIRGVNERVVGPTQPKEPITPIPQEAEKVAH